VHVEEARGVSDRAREIVDQNRRRRRGDDDFGAGAVRRGRKHLALEVDDFRHAFEHNAGSGNHGRHVP
jgi:hypothetical protein